VVSLPRRWPRAPRAIAVLLDRFPVFEALSPEDLLHVAEVAVPRSFEPHKVVFREGDDSDT
jgi:CRP/FNR family transcriptional regulator, cyclic AMP receptor protein